MVHEQIMGDRQLKSRPPRPLGEIVVIKESQSKPFIEPTDRLVNGPLHEQAKSRQLRRGEPLPAMLVAPVRGKAMHLADVAIGHILDKLRGCGIIGHGANDAGSSRQ